MDFAGCKLEPMVVIHLADVAHRLFKWLPAGVPDPTLAILEGLHVFLPAVCWGIPGRYGGLIFTSCVWIGQTRSDLVMLGRTLSSDKVYELRESEIVSCTY